MTNPKPLHDFPQWPVVVDLENRLQKTCDALCPAMLLVVIMWGLAAVAMVVALRHPFLLPFAAVMLAFAPLKTFALMNVWAHEYEPAPITLLQGMDQDYRGYSSAFPEDATRFSDFAGSDAEVIASLEALVIKGQTRAVIPSASKSASVPQLPAPKGD